MALRIPKYFTDLADAPSPAEGRVLQWQDGGLANRRLTLADLGIWVGETEPLNPITLAQWTAGVDGYFGFLQIAEGIVSWAGATTGANCSVYAVPPLVSVSAVATSPGAACPVTTPAPTVSASSFSSVEVTSPGADCTVTCPAPTVSVVGDQHFTSPGANCTVTTPAPLVSLSRTIASPGANCTVTTPAPAVTVDAGGGILLADNFTGTNGAAADGSKWENVITASAGTLTIQSNQIRASGSASAGNKSAVIRSLSSFTAVNGRYIKVVFPGTVEAFEERGNHPVVVLFGSNATKKTICLSQVYGPGEFDPNEGGVLLGTLDSALAVPATFQVATTLGSGGGANGAIELRFTSSTALQVYWQTNGTGAQVLRGTLTLPDLGGSFQLGLGAQWISSGSVAGSPGWFFDTVEVG